MEAGHPKPQPTTTLLSPSPPALAQPPTAAAMTPAELEAAIAALPAKKQRLREAFERLVACSPGPIPFRWEDLDAHLSSLQASSVAFRFHRFECLPVAAPTNADNGFEQPVEHLVGEDREPRVEHRVSEGGRGRNGDEVEESKDASLDKTHEEEKGEVREASSHSRSDTEISEAGIERVEVPIQASPEHKVDREDGEGADDREQYCEDDAEEARCQGTRAAADLGGGEAPLARAVASACANMDASALVDVLSLTSWKSVCARRAFLPALLGAADPHSLVVRAVGGFLAGEGSKTYRGWGHCVALLECVPHLLAGNATPSAGTLDQAERLAREWKEMMVGRCNRGMPRLAGWAFFTFLASYNIVLEFDADEMICLFGNLPAQLKNNCIELCEHLGLIEKMSDSVNHLVEDGKPLNAIRLASALNLAHKYSPLSIMHAYVEKAKKTAEEILSKESDPPESLNQAIAKKVNSLILSWRAVDDSDIDPVHRGSIKAEITQLLHKYANKQQSLAGVSDFTSSSHLQHNSQEQYQQQLQMPQEEQQQQKPHEQQQKPDEEQHGHQRKPQEPQYKAGEHRRRQHKAQVSRQYQLQNHQEQGCGWQNSAGRRRNNKKWKRNRRRQEPQNTQEKQFKKRPRFSAYAYSGIRGVPFAARQAI